MGKALVIFVAKNGSSHPFMRVYSGQKKFVNFTWRNRNGGGKMGKKVFSCSIFGEWVKKHFLKTNMNYHLENIKNNQHSYEKNKKKVEIIFKKSMSTYIKLLE